MATQRYGRSAARLRETLGAYFEAGGNQTRAAERLHIHPKTVAYRLRCAQALLGGSIAERRVELETTLLLHRAGDGC